MAVKRTMYQRMVDVDMLNAVKSVLADVSIVSPSSEQRVSLNTATFIENRLGAYPIGHNSKWDPIAGKLMRETRAVNPLSELNQVRQLRLIILRLWLVV